MDWIPWLVAAVIILLLLGAKRIFMQGLESSGRLKRLLHKDDE